MSDGFDKEESFWSLDFVTGSDEAAVRKAAVEFAKDLSTGRRRSGLEVIDGAVDNVEAAIHALQQASQALLTLPFLGGSKLVWLKNASFLADVGAGRSESVTGALETLCQVLESGLPEGVSFLLSAPLADKRRTGYKVLAKLATTAVYDLPNVGFRGDEEAIAEWTRCARASVVCKNASGSSGRRRRAGRPKSASTRE